MDDVVESVSRLSVKLIVSGVRVTFFILLRVLIVLFIGLLIVRYCGVVVYQGRGLKSC
jgi:hypothetical protein